MRTRPLVCIIVLNWNGGTLPINCIDSLFKNTSYQNFKIIFVDNGSTDGSVEAIQKEFRNITIIRLKKNFGFSKGMNVGAWYALRHCSPDYIIFLNNDITIPVEHCNWLSDLITDLEADPKAAIAAPKIRLPDGRLEDEWIVKGRIFVGSCEINKLQRKKCYVTYCTGACLLIKSSVLEEIGLYDERFSPFWLEDMDLFLRVKKAGYNIIYNPKNTLNHISSATIKSTKIASDQKRVIILGKNLIRYKYKHVPFYALLPSLCATIVRLLFNEKAPSNKLKIVGLNPLSILQLIKKIDLQKEKVRLSDNEALGRIKYIKSL